MAKNQTQPDDERTMELWNQVCTTDPKHTKSVDQRGGYTAIDPQYQIRMATSLWGPYGGSWALRDFQWGMIEVAEQKPTMTLDAIFNYPGGQFPISADMSYRANDDCRKKLRTAAQSKALSLLGFNADIYLGQYDDERYVQEMRTKFSDQDELRGTILNAIRGCDTTERLTKVRTTLDERYRTGIINKMLHSEMLEDIEKQKKELGQAANGQPNSQPNAPAADAFRSPPMSDAEKEQVRQQELLEK